MTGVRNRRTVLKVLASAPFSVLAGPAHASAPRRVAALIEQAKVLPSVSRRLDLISRALLGARYIGHTLTGGSNRPEVFVVREDGFDCVTYNEYVLAAALAGDVSEFEAMLRKIRYRNGEVTWRERNHYYADWCRNNVENGVCRPVALGDPVRLEKSSDTERGVGRRSWTIDAIPQATLFSDATKLITGDIVGFVSWRANLDYFHTGFIAFGRSGELILRHASSTHRRVIDEPMTRFIATNGTKYVTVLRPQELRALARAPR